MVAQPSHWLAWIDGRRRRVPNDTTLLTDLHTVIADRPTNGYWRVAARLNRPRRQTGRLPVSQKAVCRVMRERQLLLIRLIAKRPDRVDDGSDDWRRFCAVHNLEPSMSRRGNCWASAIVESFSRA